MFRLEIGSPEQPEATGEMCPFDSDQRVVPPVYFGFFRAEIRLRLAYVAPPLNMTCGLALGTHRGRK